MRRPSERGETSTSAEANLLQAVTSCRTLCQSGRWCVGHKQPQRGTLARFGLERQGYQTFLPRIVTIRRHARKGETDPLPLLPRYIFVGLDLTHERWHFNAARRSTGRFEMLLELPDAPIRFNLAQELLDQQPEEGSLPQDNWVR